MVKLVFLAVLSGMVLANGPRKLSQEELNRLAEWKEGDPAMWQLSGQFEGDMVLLPGQKNGMLDERYRWPNAEITYEVDEVFTEEEASVIHEAVKEFARKSCVTVRPRTALDEHYVHITGENTGCHAAVGYRGSGAQSMNLQRNGCLYHKTVVHEFLHVTGFWHEQSSTERDDYVTINWENIQAGKEHNFDKYDTNFITPFDQPYDCGSIMHYEETAFSANGLPTITPKDPKWVGLLGKTNEMSDIDLAKLKLMYNCP